MLNSYKNSIEIVSDKKGNSKEKEIVYLPENSELKAKNQQKISELVKLKKQFEDKRKTVQGKISQVQASQFDKLLKDQQSSCKDLKVEMGDKNFISMEECVSGFINHKKENYMTELAKNNLQL